VSFDGEHVHAAGATATKRAEPVSAGATNFRGASERWPARGAANAIAELGTCVANPVRVNEGLYSGVSAANAAERRLDAVTQNLANLDVSGFKRRATSLASFDVALRGGIERQTRSRSSVDYSQGPVGATGNPLDLALAGPGFFAVEGARGELYTRDGRFHLDASGVLQTADGLPVAWDGGRGTIDASGLAVQVDAEGVVTQGTERVGKLRIVDFAASDRLHQVGRGYFQAPRGAGERASSAEVRQGHVERANVSAVDEMVELISVQRSFESATRLLAMIDQSYRRLTSPGG
jgi:flagellar basal body rod protein FlgG